MADPTEPLKQIAGLDVKDLGLMGGFLMLVIKDVWQWVTGSAKKNLEAIHENTTALRELKIHFSYLHDDFKKNNERLEKVERDVDEAHLRIRELKREQTQ